MKVKCINTAQPIDRHKVSFEDYLIEGNTYTVERIVESCGHKFYFLKERPKRGNNNRVQYWSKRFVQIDNYSQKENAQSAKKEKVSVFS